MTDPGSVEDSIQQVIDTHGRVDILINTIGGFRGGSPVHETSLEDWDFMFDLNTRSVFLSCRSVVPHMLKQGGGKIVNISARPGVKGAANSAGYSGAKSAVIRLTESLSEELKDQGINVNCVLPGHVDTPENREQNSRGGFFALGVTQCGGGCHLVPGFRPGECDSWELHSGLWNRLNRPYVEFTTTG